MLSVATIDKTTLETRCAKFRKRKVGTAVMKPGERGAQWGLGGMGLSESKFTAWVDIYLFATRN